MKKETIGDATLYCGDCLELPDLGDIAATVTDPPYGIGTWSSSGGMRLSAEKVADLKEWDVRPDEAIARAAQSSPVVVMWGYQYLADLLGKSRAPMVWDKRNTGMQYAEAELAWTNFSWGTTRIYSRHPSGYAKQHPTQKPVEVMAWCIAQTRAAGPIFDPFMGSGTTGVAAVRLGLPFVGAEMREEYFAIACERIAAEVSQGRLFEPEPVGTASIGFGF